MNRPLLPLGLLPGLLLGLLAMPAMAERRAELPAGAMVLTESTLVSAQTAAATRAARWIGLAEAGAFGRLSEAIPAAPGDAAGELALSLLVRHLQGHPVGRNAGAGGVLERIAQRQPLAWMRHEETVGDWFVPVADPGAEARSALQLLVFERDRDDWLRRLAADADAALRSGIADPAQATRAADALRVAPQASVDAVHAFHRAHPGALPGVVLLALAERRPSAPLYAQALAASTSAQRVALVAQLPQRLPEAEALALLGEYAAVDDSASAAVLALGQLGDRPQVRARLLEWLGDERLGASAASALARSGDAAIVEVLLVHARAVAAPEAVRDVALSLRLIDTPASRHALARLAADARLPAAARRELQR